MPIFQELERVTFFYVVHRGKQLDRRLKEMSVNICNTAAHLLLISNNEIPEWISRILGYSFIKYHRWVAGSRPARSQPKQSSVCISLDFAARKTKMVWWLSVLSHARMHARVLSCSLILPCLERSCSGFSQGANYNIFIQKRNFWIILSLKVYWYMSKSPLKCAKSNTL